MPICDIPNMNKVIKFIELVEQYPCIYNSDLPEYSRKDTTERAWQEVADKIRWKVQHCKDKWKNLRNGFVRSLKSSENGVLKKPYYLYDAMKFIIPYINKTIVINKRSVEVLTPKNEPVDEESLEEDEDEAELPTNADDDQTDDEAQEVVKQEVEIRIDPLEHRQVKRPIRRLNKRPVTIDVDRAVTSYMQKRPRPLDDPKKMFLLSLLPDIKSLTDRQLGVFRIKVLMLLEDVKSRSGSELRELLNQ